MTQKMSLAIVAVTFLFILSACNTLKKRCEETNWFNHGQSIAMQGKRVDSDSFLKQCKKADAYVNYADLDVGFKKGMATYCKPETVLNMGKDGKFFKADMCDSAKARLLTRKHDEGVRIFCASSNGFKVGASGRPYNKICPKDLENGFLKTYYKGRKKYLRTTIVQKKRQIDEIDDRIDDLRRDKSDKMTELRMMGGGKVIQKERKYDPKTRTYVEETSVTEDEETQRKKRDIKWDIDRIDSNIKSARSEKKSVRSQIRDLETELASLSEEG